MNSFEFRLAKLTELHEELVTRRNRKIEPGNGIYHRYENPVLTGAHAPLAWRYDLNPATNPHLM